MTLHEKLTAAAQAHKGTELAGLLQWAALHIQAQGEALDEAREELATEEAERVRLEAALHTAKLAAEAAVRSIGAALMPPIELGRDMVAHINLMAAHGDPDYIKGANSCRHIDTRSTTKPRKAKTAKEGA